MAKSQIKTIRITKGPRKGQSILAYVRPNGKWTEVRGKGRGATKQRRAAAKAGGLKDRFGRTAADRSAVRKTQKAARVGARKKQGLSASGHTVTNLQRFVKASSTASPAKGPPGRTPPVKASIGKPVKKGSGKISQKRASKSKRKTSKGRRGK